MVKKELTQQEKDEIKLKIESIKENIVNPIIGVSLSACQYHKAFEHWPNANFVSTTKSDFDKFEILPSETNFHTKFKLKGSEFIFNLKLGVPGTKLDIKEVSYQNNEHQVEIDRMKKKIKENLSQHMKTDNNVNQTSSKTTGDCVFILRAAHPDNPIKINLSGPIILGKTWVTDAERNKFASGFFFVSSLTRSIPRKRDSNLLDKLLSNEITNAFIMVSLCSVLGVEPNNCR